MNSSSGVLCNVKNERGKLKLLGYEKLMNFRLKSCTLSTCEGLFLGLELNFQFSILYSTEIHRATTDWSDGVHHSSHRRHHVFPWISRLLWGDSWEPMSTVTGEFFKLFLHMTLSAVIVSVCAIAIKIRRVNHDIFYLWIVARFGWRFMWKILWKNFFDELFWKLRNN